MSNHFNICRLVHPPSVRRVIRVAEEDLRLEKLIKISKASNRKKPEQILKISVKFFTNNDNRFLVKRAVKINGVF